ncbi:MAG: PQQ-binding-like beta-propeller repeat protein [Actinobacteria bacterium]|nr:PQQ-binding-like beta-propeller repeat protein [Actinomycetota bacterium]
MGFKESGRVSVGQLGASLVALSLVAVGLWWATDPRSRNENPGLRPLSPSGSPSSSPSPTPTPTPRPKPEPINGGFPGLTTFRGNATRTYYGRGPLPRAPEVLWTYPASGSMCSQSVDQDGPRTWCGTGWTGQPNVVEIDGVTQVRFGAYDRGIHILNGDDGLPLYETFPTGDLIKGTVTSDPDGYPLLYSGSRDNEFRILTLDRGTVPVELWSLNADTAPQPLWNNDWDGSSLVIDDYLIEGGENSWFYVVKLNRDYDADGLVTVAPEIRALVPGFDDQLLSDLGDTDVSIENSVAYLDGVAYFANSGGLVQGWDVSRVLDGGKRIKRVFRFWTGDDTDASLVIDPEGFVYVASEQERYNDRGFEVGQLMKLDPKSPDDPIVWSLLVPGRPESGVDGGIWATPAIYKRALFVPTNTGRLLAIDRMTGEIAWEIELPEPTWSSPAVIGHTLIASDCAGFMHAYDVKRPLQGPPEELWNVQLPGCIESTPAIWKGMIYVGTRAGQMFGIGDPS